VDGIEHQPCSLSLLYVQSVLSAGLWAGGRFRSFPGQETSVGMLWSRWFNVMNEIGCPPNNQNQSLVNCSIWRRPSLHALVAASCSTCTRGRVSHHPANDSVEFDNKVYIEEGVACLLFPVQERTFSVHQKKERRQLLFTEPRSSHSLPEWNVG
jgi:hypothetical protein